MSTAVVSFHVCTCDGCGRRYESPSPDDETAFQAERRATRYGGWKTDGGDLCCPACLALPAVQRPNVPAGFWRGAKKLAAWQIEDAVSGRR